MPARKKYRVVALFSGMGQLDLGFEAAGFEVVAAYEFWQPAVEAWNRNHENKVCQLANVKEMGPRDVPDFDLLIGGPPCQPFSQARKHQATTNRTGVAKHGHGIKDERNCIPDFLRIADGRPFLMENVEPGLLELHGRFDSYARRLVASKFGDVTHRRRWFYSDAPFSPVECPTERRFRHPDRALDIRDWEADFDDERYFENRYTWKDKWARHVDDDGFFATIVTTSHWVHNNLAQGNLIAHPKYAAGTPRPKWPIQELVRCPVLSEIMRAHSVPESWDWGIGQGRVPPTRKGAKRGSELLDDAVKMIGNGVPVGMATAVAKAVLERLRSDDRETMATVS